ncbi:hypothetical protein [Nocardia sp. NPDC057440]|uniref:hypothetical protein n=1 Tax=Nocardia sp. NPDC057440 TaxID=3346134 RepID=UPI0036704F6E
MPDRASELATTLKNTENAVRELSAQVNLNEQAVRSAKFASRAALVGIAFDMLLTAVVGWGLFGVDNNQDRIDELQSRNKRSTCAMVALFLQFEPRTTTNPGYTEEQRAQQVTAYQTLRQISHDLGCAEQ